MARVFVLDDALAVERGADVLARRAKELLAQGVTDVALSVGVPASAPFPATMPPEPFPGALIQAQQALVAAGMHVALVRTHGDVRDPEACRRLRSVVAEAGSLELAVLLTLGSSSLHDEPSAPRADKPAAELLQQLADGVPTVRLMLYPQPGLWLARLEDAVRLTMRTNRRNVGLALNLSDLIAQEPSALEARLLLAKSRLWAVMLRDSTEPVEDEMVGTEGRSSSPRLRHALTILARLGYVGPIGIHVPATAVFLAEQMDETRHLLNQR